MSPLPSRRMVLPALVCLGVAVGGAAWLSTARRDTPELVCADPLASAILTSYEPARNHAAASIAYPLDETLFPPDIAAPTFRWTDRRADAWAVLVEFADGGPPLGFAVREPQWRPSPSDWEAIKRRTTEAEAAVTVVGVHEADPTTTLSAGRVRIATSPDEVGAPIFYREVNLPFVEAVKDPSHIRWRFGPVSSTEQPPVVLEKLPVCGNCHSFSADGSLLGMDVDYANDKGSYVLSPVGRQMVLDPAKVITWSDYRREDGENTFGLLSQVSPDGRYAVSTVKDRSVFVPRDELAFSQLFFPIKGILGVHDRQTGTFRALPGADDRRFVQSNPAWSPDGTQIVFARSKAATLEKVHAGKVLLSPKECEEFLFGGRPFKFDLCRIPFNEGKGGQAAPIPGASANGMSNYFARISPDGRWLVFCRARNFMLLQPDSQLYIMPATGGEPRRMRCNTPRMNSWHSWSPNSRWLVFSAKANGPYTQLWLTHVDEQGRSTPPVVLERFTAPDRAANIPEFVNAAPDAIASIAERFVDDHSYERAGNEFLRSGDPERAAAAYRRALAMNPRNAEAHTNLGVIVLNQGHVQQAEAHFQKALAILPSDARCHRNIADIHVREKRTKEAMAAYREALRLDPAFTEARLNLGLLLLIDGKLDAGAAEFAEAARRDPTSAQAHYHLARARMRQKRSDEAVPEYRRALELAPDSLPVLMGLATIRAAGPDGALRDGAEAVELASRAARLTRRRDAKVLDVLAAAHAQAGQFPEAIAAAREAIACAQRAGDARHAHLIQARLALYTRSQPIPARDDARR